MNQKSAQGSPKIAFYPCCASDFSAPIRLLKGIVDLVIFCDIKFYGPLPQYPMARYIRDDVRNVLKGDLKFDLFFYRHDSMGEGGSEVPLLNKHYLSQIVKHFPPEGGMIITDGSNSVSFIKRSWRGEGYCRKDLGIMLTSNHNYPEIEEARLMVLNVSFWHEEKAAFGQNTIAVSELRRKEERHATRDMGPFSGRCQLELRRRFINEEKMRMRARKGDR